MAVIRKTRTKKWELDFYSGGKRQRVTFESRREAEEAKRQVMLGLPADTSEPQIQATSLKEGIRFYVANISTGKASEENERKYFERLFKALRALGKSMVHEVTSADLEQFKTQRLKDCKPSTVNREFNTYRHFFTKAVAWKWIEKSPCDDVQTIPEAKNPRRVWTDEELEKVLSKVPEWVSDAIRVMNWLGAGPTELSRVTWADIDFERKTILLKRYKGTGEEIRRHIDLPETILEFFDTKKHRAKVNGRARPADLVFLNSVWKPINHRALSTIVRRAVRFHGLPDGTTPYGVRHKFATEMLEGGVPEDVVRRLMGHRDVRTLIENYSHVRRGPLADAMRVREGQAAKISTKKGDGDSGR